MTAKQTWFFPSEKPLEKRLGKSFFSSIPKSPGVYYLRDADQKPLYIGQSGNLRERLRSYKNAQAPHTPRRILRLVCAARMITWETMASAEAALLREEELLRTIKPKFNRANIYPEGYKYLEIEPSRNTLTIRECKSPPKSNLGFGAFKGTHRQALGALGRLCFRIQHQVPNWWDLPSLLRDKLRCLELSSRERLINHHCGATVEDLVEFFAGSSQSLVHHLSESVAQLPGASAFDQQWMESDLEIMTQFFTTNTARNRKLCEFKGARPSVIAATELNALILEQRMAMKAISKT